MEYGDIGSDNGLSPGWYQAIIWTNTGLMSIGTIGTNFNEVVIEIQAFSFKKMHLKMLSGKWRPFCLGLNVKCIFLCTPGPRPNKANGIHCYVLCNVSQILNFSRVYDLHSNPYYISIKCTCYDFFNCDIVLDLFVVQYQKSPLYFRYCWG